MRHDRIRHGIAASIATVLGVMAMAGGASAQVAAGATVQGNVQIGAPSADVSAGVVAPPGYVQAQPGYVQAQPVYAPQQQPVFVGSARPVPYEGGPVPPGMRVVTRPNTGLAVAGGVLFLSAYGAVLFPGLIIGAAPYAQSALLLAIPVVGPVVLTGVHCGNLGGGCGSLMIAAAIDTLAQAAGVAMFIAGLSMQRQMLVWNGMGRAPARHDRVQWAVGPSFIRDAPGLSFAMTHF